MEGLKITFHKPNFTKEEWEEKRKQVEAIKAEEQERKFKAALDRSRIPLMYQNASLLHCEDSIRNYAQSIDKGLVIDGRAGRGKTYSGCAILRSFVGKFPVHFVQSKELIEASYPGNEKGSHLIGVCRKSRLLLIDDFGKEKPTDHALGEIWKLLDHRISWLKPTIITTQYGRREMIERLASGDEKETAIAIVSRLYGNDFDHITLTGKDRRFS